MKEESKTLEPTGWGGDLVHIHTGADRKIKVLKSDGTEGEAMWSDALRGLLVKANVPYADALGEVVHSVRDAEIDARRAAGLPDLCEHDGCKNTLSMNKPAMARRSRKPHPWLCGSAHNSVAVPARVLERRAAGLADTCDWTGCTAELGMSQKSPNRRDRMYSAGKSAFFCPHHMRGKERPLDPPTSCARCARPLSTGKEAMARRARLNSDLCKQCGRLASPDSKAFAGKPETCRKCDGSLSMKAKDRLRRVGRPDLHVCLPCRKKARSTMPTVCATKGCRVPLDTSTAGVSRRARGIVRHGAGRDRATAVGELHPREYCGKCIRRHAAP